MYIKIIHNFNCKIGTLWKGETFMSSQMVNMRYPALILNKIDQFKEKNGFTTRTQTILYLVQYALEQLEKEEKNDEK